MYFSKDEIKDKNKLEKTAYLQRIYQVSTHVQTKAENRLFRKHSNKKKLKRMEEHKRHKI